MDFLLEIGTEEIPARMIDAAADALFERVGTVLFREGLMRSEDAKGEKFTTPRRLAVYFPLVKERQTDTTAELTGPPIKAAFKDGAPTAAAHAFAKKAGVAVDQLQRVTT